MGEASEQTLRLGDERERGFVRWNARVGRPVQFCHGSPGSRLFRPPVERTAATARRSLTTVFRGGEIRESRAALERSRGAAEADEADAVGQNPGTPETIFGAHGLTKVYTSGEVEGRALRGLNLEIWTGEVVVPLGPSGSGKSTLLNIMGGLDHATSGGLHFKDPI